MVASGDGIDGRFAIADPVGMRRILDKSPVGWRPNPFAPRNMNPLPTTPVAALLNFDTPDSELWLLVAIAIVILFLAGIRAWTRNLLSHPDHRPKHDHRPKQRGLLSALVMILVGLGACVYYLWMSNRYMDGIIQNTIAVMLCIVVVLQFASLWLPTPERNPIAKMAQHRGAALLFLLIAGLGCGLLGNWIDSSNATLIANPSMGAAPSAVPEVASPSLSWTDRLYSAWGQFFMNGDVNPRDSLWTRIARMFGMTFLTLAAFEAFSRFFAGSILNYRIRHQRRHVLICGSGRIGKVLALDLLKSRK
jgi:hypothetical protein